MTVITCTLFDFLHGDKLLSVFGGYSNDYVYTPDGVFRRVVPPVCPECGTGMTHNGYNTYCKKGLGGVKIGRYVCPSCGTGFEEKRGFWERIKADLFAVLDRVYQRLRNLHVSYQGISSVMELIFPQGKDTIAHAFNDSVDKAVIPQLEDVQIVHYDEQHPKRGRTQKFRLTLLDGITGRPIAEELSDKKDPETIKNFLTKYLDPNKPTFVVTDMYPSYPAVFEEFFGENLILQLCLMHLNKRIVQDFPRKTTFEQELMKYRLLNIFYNRDPEIEVLIEMAEEEQVMKQKDENGYKAWLKKNMGVFRKFLHDQELERRREKKNLDQRSYLNALCVFNELMEEIDSFEKPIQKRLRKIEKNWEYFTAFYFVKDTPATNNLIENYYSTSLKTHRKKQLRTDKGIKNQMKLSAMKRAGLLDRCGKTLLDAFSLFIPFLDYG